MPKLTSALRAAGWQLGLVFEEVARRVPTPQTERDPVAERSATLFLDPVALTPGHSRHIVGTTPFRGSARPGDAYWRSR